MSRDQALENYRKLLVKTDEKFQQIRTRHQDQFQCRMGCHSCCQPAITVSAVEKDNIRNYLQFHPGIRQKIEDLDKEDPHKGSRCKFLDSKGACSIYPVRPVVCRSHGAPLRISFDDITNDVPDVCHLNFTKVPLQTLPLEDFIQLNTLNTLLMTINQQFVGNRDKEMQRFELNIQEIMK